MASITRVQNIVVSYTVMWGYMRPLISWDADVPNGVGLANFKVYRAGAGATSQNDFELVGITNLNYFADQSIELSRVSPVAYKVTWVDRLDNESSLKDATLMKWYQSIEQVTTSKGFGGVRDRMFYSHLEHQKRIGWMQQNFGENVYIYVRNSVGQLCPYYDEDTGEHKEERCTTCWNTGIVPGYTIFKSQAAFQTTPDRLDWIDRGFHMQSRVNFRMSPFPWIKEGDLIRRQNGEFGEINNIKRDNWQTEVEAEWNVLTAHTILHEMPIDDDQDYVVDLLVPQLMQSGMR